MQYIEGSDSNSTPLICNKVDMKRPTPKHCSRIDETFFKNAAEQSSFTSYEPLLLGDIPVSHQTSPTLSGSTTETGTLQVSELPKTKKRKSIKNKSMPFPLHTTPFPSVLSQSSSTSSASIDLYTIIVNAYGMTLNHEYTRSAQEIQTRIDGDKIKSTIKLQGDCIICFKRTVFVCGACINYSKVNYEDHRVCNPCGGGDNPAYCITEMHKRRFPDHQFPCVHIHF